MTDARYGVTVGLFCLLPVLAWTLSHDFASTDGQDTAAIFRVGRDALWLAQNIVLVLAIPSYAAKNRFVGSAMQSAVIVAVALPFQALVWATGAAEAAELALRTGGSLGIGLALAAISAALNAAATRFRFASSLTPTLQATLCIALVMHSDMFSN